MSETTHRGQPDESNPEGKHETTPADLRDGELIRVVADGHEVDRAAVIATWPFSQLDFTPERHAEAPEKPRGRRATLETQDGGRYAIVDWSGSDDPPYLYLLVIDGDDPDARRWNSLGAVVKTERYGSEPEYRMNPFNWYRGGTKLQNQRVLELAATGEFDGTAAATALPDADTLQDLADAHRSDEPATFTRDQIEAINTAYRAAREHVEQTAEPILSCDAETDLSNLETEYNANRYLALFPDGDGGQIKRKPPGSAPPSENVPPWVAEQDADPTFAPLGRDPDV